MSRTVPALLAIACLCLAVSNANAVTPYPLWAHNPGGTNVDNVADVAVDPWGNVVVTGYFGQTIDLGGTVLDNSAGSIYLAKYTPDGTLLWAKAVGGSISSVLGVATDAQGNIVIVGTFTLTANFGGSTLTSNASSADIFIARYGPGGGHDWSVGLGGSQTDYARDVACGLSGDIYVTGEFQGTANFGGSNLTSNGSTDIFIAKYAGNGAHQWSQGHGGTLAETAAGIAIGALDAVYITGGFQGTVSFGVGNLVSAGSSDVYLAKYLSNGTYVWARRYGGTNTDYGSAIDVDPADNIVLTGYSYGDINFGFGTLANAGDIDFFLARVNNSGTIQWARMFGSTSTDRSYSIDTDTANNIYVAAQFSNTVNFGGGNRVTPINTIGGVLLAHDANGAYLWDRAIVGNPSVTPYAVDATTPDDIVLAGSFFGRIDFENGPLFSVGASDAFMVRYGDGMPQPAITSISDVPNDQGHKVKIRFDRSLLDDVRSGTPVTRYLAFRRDDAGPAITAGGRVLAADGWTQVGSVDAFGEGSYGIDVPTIGDSTQVLGQYYSAFYVRAATDVSTTFYDSAPDSGYSVDNLAPGIPGSLLYNSGVLSWNDTPAEDFDYYSVYGGATNSFGAATLVNYTIDVTMDVTASPYAYYFVTATDFSGNEGAPIRVNAASGAGGTPHSYVLSLSNYPNPFNPRTSVAYTVPARGNVTVAIYDARGARVAVLVNNETRDAGGYRVDWAGRDDHGAVVPSGVYFARIERAGEVRTRKMVLLK